MRTVGRKGRLFRTGQGKLQRCKKKIIRVDCKGSPSTAIATEIASTVPPVGIWIFPEKLTRNLEEKGLTSSNLDNAYKLVEIMKGVDKIEMMQDGGGYSHEVL